MRYRLAILTSQINQPTIAAMLKAAVAAARRHKVEIISITSTIGCLDMPVIAQVLLKKKKVDALVVIGAVAQGETKHDQLVVNTMTAALVKLSLQMRKPVAFGVIGPGARRQQFKARTKQYAERAITAAVRNIQLLRQLA